MALALVNTEVQVGGRRVDLIPDEATAGDWLERHDLGPLPKSAQSAWPDGLHALRESLGEVLRAVADGRPPPPKHLRRLNDTARRAPGARQLGWRQDAVTVDWKPAGRPAALDVLLARIAEDGIRLAAEEGTRLRNCGAQDCARMLVAHDPRRVWCSTACGDRTRVARHYEKQRRSRGD